MIILATTVTPQELIKGKFKLYPLKYPPICTFASKVSNVTLYPSKLSNCDNSTTLTFSFPKCPYHIFYFIFKKIQKKKKKTKQKEKKINMLGWFGHPIIFLFFSKKIKKQNMWWGHFGKKRSKWLNCHNLKVWGELSDTFETFEVKV